MNTRPTMIRTVLVVATALACISCTHTQRTSSTARPASPRYVTSAEKELTQQEQALNNQQQEDQAREQQLRKAVDLNPDRRAGARP